VLQAGLGLRHFTSSPRHISLTFAPQNKVPGSLQMQKLLGSAQAAAGAGSSKFTTSPRLRAPPSAARPTLTSRETITTDGAPEDERETAQQAVAAIKEAVGVLSEEEGSRSSTQVGLQNQTTLFAISGLPFSAVILCVTGVSSFGLCNQAAQRRRRAAKEGSSLREPGRNVAIVTTAALPWMTGTAVNPLLRAAYLARDEEQRVRLCAGLHTSAELQQHANQCSACVHGHNMASFSSLLFLQGESGSQVNLVIPWLAPADQAKVFPNNLKFDTPADQEKYVREWAAKRTGFDCNFKVLMPFCKRPLLQTLCTLPPMSQLVG
jgi:hypothetical protein